MDATVVFSSSGIAHLDYGTTALCPTTMTCPDELLKIVIACYKEAKNSDDGAEMLGLRKSFFCSRKRCTAVWNNEYHRKILEDILKASDGTILRWDAAPELPNMYLFAEVMKRYGVLASAAHTVATAEETLRMFDAGFSHVTHF